MGGKGEVRGWWHSRQNRGVRHPGTRRQRAPGVGSLEGVSWLLASELCSLFVAKERELSHLELETGACERGT